MTRVTMLTSLWTAKRHLEGFCENILEQTHSDIENIFIISGSPEAKEEREILSRYWTRFKRPILIETAWREGLYTAWNRGVREASGEYIMNANVDDRMSPTLVEKLSRVLNEEPEIYLVYNDHEEWRMNGTMRCIREMADYDYEKLLEKCFCGIHPMWRKKVVEEIGYFDESYESAGDYDFWLRIGLRHPMKRIPEALSRYLDNLESLWHRTPTVQDEAARARKKARAEWERIKKESS